MKLDFTTSRCVDKFLAARTVQIREAYQAAAAELFQGLVRQDVIEKIMPFVRELADSTDHERYYYGSKISEVILLSSSSNNAAAKLLGDLSDRMAPDFKEYGKHFENKLAELKDGTILTKYRHSELGMKSEMSETYRRIGQLLIYSIYERTRPALEPKNG